MSTSGPHASDRSAPIRVAVWCTSDQASLVQRVLGHPWLTLAGVCGVDGTQTAALASALAAPPVDDARQLARSPEADVIWLAADADLHEDSLRSAAVRTPLVVTALPAASSELRRARWSFAPRTSELLGAGSTLLAELGAVHGASLELGAEPLAGGLGMALLDAADLACNLLGRPEAVAATFVDSDGRPMRPTALRRFAGTACLLVRGAAGRGLSVTVSSASPEHRRLLILGEHGRLLLEQETLRWNDRGGREIERIERGPAPASGRVAQEIAVALRDARHAAPHGRSDAAPWDAEAIALRFSIVEAARLSGVTGATESVASLLAAFSAAGA